MESKKKEISLYIFGGTVSIISSLALIILFAFIIKWFALSDSIISPVNMLIKAISILLGLILILKNRKGGLVKGCLFGVTYSLIAFIVFSILSGAFTFTSKILLDCLYCAVVGGLIGIIIVNIKSK